MFKGRFDHAVIPVRTGKMELALGFMQAFGFEKEEYEARGDWGYAYFVRNEKGGRIQLTMPNDQQPFVDNTAPDCDTRALGVSAPMLPWVHIAIECDIPKMRGQIVKWASRHNLSVELEDVPGDKVFVSLVQVFWIDIELVPHVSE